MSIQKIKNSPRYNTKLSHELSSEDLKAIIDAIYDINVLANLRILEERKSYNTKFHAHLSGYDVKDIIDDLPCPCENVKYVTSRPRYNTKFEYFLTGEDVKCIIDSIELGVNCSCPEVCLTIDDIGDLPDPLVCDFVYYSPINQQQATYFVYNTGLAQWDAIYSVISTDQAGDDFTEIRIDLLAGWSLSVDGGATWIDTAGIHAINVPAPMVITIRNDTNGCTYVGQTLELEYTIWFATFDNGGSWPMNFDCGSYGSGFANDNGEYATFLQTDVTTESGSGFFGTVVSLWITLPKDEVAPVDWTFGVGPATPINFAQQTTGRKIFGCLQASYTVADASLWNPYLLTDGAFGLQGEVTGTLPYDDPAIEALLSTFVTNMYGATASATLDVTGNDIVFTIMDTMLLDGGIIDSTEDFVILQPDAYIEFDCP